MFISPARSKLTNLWYFWDGPPMPPMIRLGIETLVRHASGFDIYSLNMQNIKQYLPSLPDKWEKKIRGWAQRVDYLRPRILHHYGGIFTDVDVVCLNDLSILTDLLISSNKILLGDGFSKKIEGKLVPYWMSVGILAAKPKCSILANHMIKQDEIIKEAEGRVRGWHTLGGASLKTCLTEEALTIWQRPCPVGKWGEISASYKHWTKFLRPRCKKPVVWPLYFSSGPKLKYLSENDILNGYTLLTKAFKYGLGLSHCEKIYL